MKGKKQRVFVEPENIPETILTNPTPCMRCRKKLTREEVGGHTILIDDFGFAIFFLCKSCVKAAPKGSKERKQLQEKFLKERKTFLDSWKSRPEIAG